MAQTVTYGVESIAGATNGPRSVGLDADVLIIASVPHTGSHFLVDLLEQSGYDIRLHHVYGGESMEWLLEYGKIAPVISPLRHPMSVAQSWKNREKPIFKHDVHAPMVEMFQNLIELAQRVKVYFLPLDMPCRDIALTRVSEVAGRILTTRWAYYGPGPVTPEIPLSPEDKASVRDLLTHPFFRPYYA